MYKTLLIIAVFISCGHNSDNVVHQPLAVFGDPMPLVKIKSAKRIQDEPKTAASMQIILKDSLLFSGKIGVEFRGAISQQFYEKKSYGIEIWDDKKKGIAKSILGMPKDEDWILHGPYADKTLIRNVLAYELSNSIGKYAPKTQFVELEINGDFKGLYVLMEKIKRGKNRVNIMKLPERISSPDSISGGYILKLDKTVGSGFSNQDEYDESNSFSSLYDQSGKRTKDTKIHFLFDYPKAKNISEVQKTYIKNYISQFEAALRSPTFNDATTGFRKYIDENSFIDYFLLTEFLQNFDGYRISTYLQKDRGQKLKMGPIWDFDLSFGSNGFCYEMKENNNYWIYKYNDYCGGDMWVVPFWWKRLLQDKQFVEKVNLRWKKLRDAQFSDKNLLKNIDSHVEYLQKTKAIERNFHRWDILNDDIEPNKSNGNYEEEVKYLKRWILNRTAWMDVEITKI